MLVHDVMTAKVVAVEPTTGVTRAVALLLLHRIGALPVLDRAGGLVGIVSDADLIRRHEIGTERHLAWWRSWLVDPEERARRFVRSHGTVVADVMSAPAISVSADATLRQLADLFEEHRVRHLPVLASGRLVGIVSRTDVLRGLLAACRRMPESQHPQSADTMYLALCAGLSEVGIRQGLLGFTIEGDGIRLSGYAESPLERRAAHLVAEEVAGVAEVRDDIRLLPACAQAAWYAG